MAATWLILMIPLGLVLLAGFGLSVRNFFRHGRAARVALLGYLLLLMWFWCHCALLGLEAFAPPNPFWHSFFAFFQPAAHILWVVAQPLGFALLAWAVFVGRQKQVIRPQFRGHHEGV